jgi:hypothetical protein
MTALYKRATEAIRKMVGYSDTKPEPDYDAMMREHPAFARKVIDSLSRSAREIARHGIPSRTPDATIRKIYMAAELAGLPREEIDARVEEIDAAYREAKKMNLQMAETQPIEVTDLLGEAEPITA